MPPKPGSQTIAVHVLVNMSRSKCNQTMKFDQLIEYNMKNIEILKYWNWAADLLLLPHIKHFERTKRGLELVSLLHFPHDLEEQYFSC